MENKSFKSDQNQELREELKAIKQKLDRLLSNSKKEVYSNDDLCDLLDISKRTLQTYRDKKLISYSQIGAKIFYSKTDVEEFLTSCRIPKNNRQ